MKAIICTRSGTPDDLELTDLSKPVAAPGEVVVAIKAVGLNFFDTLIIAGKYQFKPQFPFSPGQSFRARSEAWAKALPLSPWATVSWATSAGVPHANAWRSPPTSS